MSVNALGVLREISGGGKTLSAFYLKQHRLNRNPKIALFYRLGKTCRHWGLMAKRSCKDNAGGRLKRHLYTIISKEIDVANEQLRLNYLATMGIAKGKLEHAF